MRARCLLAVVLLLAVVTIFVSPVVDLPKTALRSIQAFQRLALALAFVATVVARSLFPLMRSVFLPQIAEERVPDELSPALALPLLC